jgi:catechol 2,3-dioxygenase-like lactoylglutathione lyase family enzyme
MSAKVTAIDHLVLTVRDIEATIAFYQGILGMEARTFQVADGSLRHALYCGSQKINLHQVGAEFAPHAKTPSAGSADLCFLSETPTEEWIAHLKDQIEEGPVGRSGATGPIMSLYVWDPDGNLIEIATAV